MLLDLLLLVGCLLLEVVQLGLEVVCEMGLEGG